MQTDTGIGAAIHWSSGEGAGGGGGEADPEIFYPIVFVYSPQNGKQIYNKTKHLKMVLTPSLKMYDVRIKIWIHTVHR